MDIKTIRKRVQDGNYLVQIHAVQHALKEGFERKHMVEAILTGKIIEEYPDLEPEDIRSALQYAAWTAGDISFRMERVAA